MATKFEKEADFFNRGINWAKQGNLGAQPSERTISENSIHFVDFHLTKTC